MAVISSIVEGLERRGRHNVNRVAVSCVVLNNELFIFVYPLQHMVVEVVPEFLRTLVFARPRGDDQFADCTFSPSLDMSR